MIREGFVRHNNLNWIEKLKPSFQSSRIELPIQNYQQLQVLQDRFYFQQGRKISVYRLKM